VIQSHCEKYLQRGKPIHLAQRVNDTAYSIVAQYQSEYVGIVQYYKLAYNVSQLSKLKGVMQHSLTKTLAKKYKTNVAEIYRRYRALHHNEYGTYKVLEVKVDRGPDKAPLKAHFGGVPLRKNRWVTIHDELTRPIWSPRSELIERLLAQRCELCGNTEKVEVHHLRKLADLERRGRNERPKWMSRMASRKRKSLVVCQNCHNQIHYGRYAGPGIKK